MQPSFMEKTMVWCVCLNPAIDKTIILGKLVPGGTNRAKEVLSEAGGKAVNVAVVLNELGVDATVVGLMGRQGSDLILDKLDAHGIGHDFVQTEGNVRVNTKLFSEKDHVTTEINEPGHIVDARALKQVIDKVRDAARPDDLAILTGSLPPGCDDDTYANIIAELQKNGVRCVLDAEGASLRAGMEQKPFLVKPNIDEMRGAYGLHGGEDEAAELCRSLVQGGIPIIALSMGGQGAMLFSEDGDYFAPPQAVDVRSTVGAGDSMLAGIIAYLDQGMGTALRAGVAAATAAITCEGTSLCTAELFHKYFDQDERIVQIFGTERI